MAISNANATWEGTLEAGRGVMKPAHASEIPFSFGTRFGPRDGRRRGEARDDRRGDEEGMSGGQGAPRRDHPRREARSLIIAASAPAT